MPEASHEPYKVRETRRQSAVENHGYAESEEIKNMNIREPVNGVALSNQGVFISHSHQDREFAQRLASDLTKKGIQVWFDGWKLELGDDLTRKIQAAIQTHRFLIIILSPDALKSEWVNIEWTAAFVRGIEEKRECVLPLLYRGCDIPLFLRRLVLLDFRDASQYQLQLQTLESRLLQTKRPPHVPADDTQLAEDLLRIYLDSEIRNSAAKHPLSSLNKIWMMQVYQLRLLLKQPMSASHQTEDDLLKKVASFSDEKENSLWISGEPGIGKTWLIHRWRGQLAQDRLSGSPVRIPIYLSLRDLSNRLAAPHAKLPTALPWAIASIPDYVEDSICGLLDSKMRHGEAVVFLDGRDEIQADTERPLAEWVAQQQKEYPGTLFVFTTRPAAHWWQRDMAATYEVLPLDDEQVDSFVQKWFGGRPGDQTERVKRTVRSSPGLGKLVRNPMILTMVCMSWERWVSTAAQAQTITGFYEACARLLLEDWDHMEHRKLDRSAPVQHSKRRATVEEKLDVLTHVASHTFPNATIPVDTLRSLVREALPNDFGPEDVIQDIHINSGLLRCPDSGQPSPRRHWEFSHLTFAEFFAARGDAMGNNVQPPEVLASHFWDPQWENRMALAIDMRPDWRVALVSAALKYIPPDVGRAGKVIPVRVNKKFVILVDMCVDNWSGRMNIVRLLRPLIATGITNLITTSGADGYIDTSWFKAFPDEEIRRDVALHFVKKLEIAGVEYLSIATDLDFAIWGTEDRELYVRQLNLFNEGKRWNQEYQGLYARRAKFAAKVIVEQMERLQVEVTAMTAEPLLLWEMEKQLVEIGVPFSTVDPHCDDNAGDFERYLAVMRNQRTPFEEVLEGGKETHAVRESPKES